MRSNSIATTSARPPRASSLDPNSERVGPIKSALPWSDWLQVLGLAAFVIALLLMRIEPGLAPLDGSKSNPATSGASTDQQPLNGAR
jgi:hypothetical protein